MREPIQQKRCEDDLVIDLDFTILHEDTACLIVDKPAHLPVHPTGRFKSKNLLSLLEKTTLFAQGELHIITRIDSETSGLVLIAKGDSAARFLSMQAETKNVQKEYSAWVLGQIDKTNDSIALPLIYRKVGEIHKSLASTEGKSCQTDYELVRHQPSASLLKIIPQGGRTHQIRCHLATVGYPIAGDKLYIDSHIFLQYRDFGWSDAMLPALKSPRLLLQCDRLRFVHPLTKTFHEFKSQKILPEPSLF